MTFMWDIYIFPYFPSELSKVTPLDGIVQNADWGFLASASPSPHDLGKASLGNGHHGFYLLSSGAPPPSPCRVKSHLRALGNDDP